MTRNGSSKRKHTTCFCAATIEQVNQMMLACPRLSTQMERIESGLEALTEKVTQFVTNVNENLIVPKDTRRGRWTRRER